MTLLWKFDQRKMMDHYDFNGLVTEQKAEFNQESSFKLYVSLAKKFRNRNILTT